MMTHKIFREDPYLTRLDAEITSMAGECVAVDQTIAYAFSGGQESDEGSIGGYPILEAQKQGKDILYTLSSDHCLKVGDQVAIQIDRQRRYALMKLHFAAEIILELLNQHYGHPPKIGAHISAGKARVDVIRQGNIAEIFPDLHQRAKQIIDANYDIISAFSDPETEIRYREIPAFGKVNCGGTHIHKTGEIGNISLQRQHLGKDKERIEIFLVV